MKNLINHAAITQKLFRIITYSTLLLLICFDNGNAEGIFTPPLIQTIPVSQDIISSRGIASWYSHRSRHIHKYTANGERFDDTQMTCASWYFDFGTYLEVTNLENGKSVVCRVNDRGPHKKLNRMIDLTASAFRKIGSLKEGLTYVSITPLREFQKPSK